MKRSVVFGGIVVIVLGVLAFMVYRPFTLDTSADLYRATPTATSTVDATTTQDYQMTNDTQASMQATLNTNKGVITLELYGEQTPETVGNFVKLAQEGYYDGTKFHRVIDDFMIQGGDPLTKDDTMQARWGTGGPGYQFKDEIVSGLSNVTGTISMANAGPNTNGSQFFINVADNTFLDGKHAVFGRVTAGMDVVLAISQVARNSRDVPNDPVVIESVVITQ